MDRLTSLTAFVRVVDSGGFSAAGRRLNMSTTMVSNHVQALEDRLGARLLQRTTRKVSLTEVGKAYYDRCVQILADIEQADDIAGALQSTPRGTLRIYTATHIVQFVAPVVAEFLGAYPEVKVDLTMGERTVDMIDEGFDVAVRLTPPPDSSLIVRSLATWRHVLCCSHGYLEKHGRPQQLSELADRNCVRHVNYPYDEMAFRRPQGRAGFGAGLRQSDHPTAARRCARSRCRAAAYVSRRAFWSTTISNQGRLVRLLPEYRPVEFAMNAVYPHRHHLSAKVRTFIDMLAHHSAEQQKLINPYS